MAAMPAYLIADNSISSSSKMVLLALSSFAGPRGIKPRQESLAQRAGLSLATVKRALVELRDAGLVDWESARFREVCSYRLTFPLAIAQNELSPLAQNEPLEVLNTNTNKNSVVDGVVNSPADSASAPPHVKVGLARPHAWYPHADHVAAATAVERHMDADDYVDRYILRRGGVAKCDSKEWLQWYLDDDARSRRDERAEARTGGALTDDTGTPLNWRL